jgi:hypothetical protein
MFLAFILHINQYVNQRSQNKILKCFTTLRIILSSFIVKKLLYEFSYDYRNDISTYTLVYHKSNT